MKTATTLQFRDAVRAAIQTLGNPDIGRASWTDRVKGDRTKAYVAMGYPRNDARSVVKLVETQLNARGLTASARVSASGYIRGTCVIIAGINYSNRIY